MQSCRPVIFLAILSIALAAGSAPAGAGPAVFTVTKTQDTADGSCDADCSLREAVVAANTSPGHQQIIVPAGAFALTIPESQDEDGSTGDLDLQGSVSIQGAGRNLTEIDGSGFLSLFDVADGASAEISDLTLMNGSQHGNAGAVWISGALSLARVSVVENSASAHGGALYLRGDALTIVDSTVSGNTAGLSGGGIGVNGGTLTIVRSTISGNTAANQGGGLSIIGGDVEIINSTFSGNKADTNGGGVFLAAGDLNIVYSTLADNTADADANGTGDGGGVSLDEDTATLSNSILDNADAGGEANNCALSLDSTMTSLGHNVISDTGGCSISGLGATDVVGDPLLSPLADHGGPTETQILLPGSPAIDNGDDSVCPSGDQRGVTRPKGAHCDSGAVEFDVAPGQRPWGDVDCDGDVDSVDALAILRFVAGLPPLNAQPCLPLGVDYTIAEPPADIIFGDLNCDGEVNAVDGLAVLRHVAGLPPIAAGICPGVGSPVQFVKF